MSRKYDSSSRNELKLLGICARCKINPRTKTKGRTKAYCSQCEAELASEHYYRMKAGKTRTGSKPLDDVMLQRYKSSAAIRTIAFNLTDAQAVEIFHKPCHYCLLPVSMGIDRVDSSLNYDIENVVPCCGICNAAKLARTAEQYETWLQGAVDRLIAKRIESGWKAESKSS